MFRSTIAGLLKGLCLSAVFSAAAISMTAQDAKPAKDLPIAQKKSDLLAGFSKAIAYSGFRTGQHPDRGEGAKNPSDAEMLEDLKILTRNRNFGLIRLYDSGENSRAVLRLIRAKKLPLKVMLGLWLEAEVHNPGCPWLTQPIPQATLDAGKVRNKQELERGIQLARQYADIVVAVNVGNECQVNWNDHMVPEDVLIAYIRTVKKAIRQPVTTADNYEWWVKQGAKVAAEVDFVAVHTYPAWENKSIDEALAYSIKNIQDIRNALPNSRIVISEAGWTDVASEFGARASQENQKRYINEMLAWTKSMNITFFIFEAFDEDWKGDPNNPLGAEKHWGLFTVDRKAKLVMQELYPDLAQSKEVPLTQKKSDLLAGFAHGIGYSGYRHGQHPDRGEGAINPSDAEMLEDFKILGKDKNFQLLCLFDSGENSESVLRLIRKHKLPMKVLLSLWLNAEVTNPGCSWLQPIPQPTLEANKIKNQQEVERGIRLAKEYAEIVVAVSVGTETQASWTDHMVPEEALIGYIRAVKQAVPQPVTTADNDAWWAKQGAKVAREVDFVAVDNYPIWDKKEIDEALPYSIQMLQAIRKAIPDRRLVITQAGWTTESPEFGPKANEVNQKRYIHELLKWTKSVNITCILFEAFDEDWKGDPGNAPGGEKHWGLFTVDRKPKLIMQNKYPELMPRKAK